MNPPPVEYIGDGVYVQMTKWGELVLTTGRDSGPRPENTIVLEPAVYAALVAFVERNKRGDSSTST